MSILKHSKQSFLYFDTTSTILTPGCPLIGEVHLVLARPMQTKKVMVSFEGRVHVGHKSDVVCSMSQVLFADDQAQWLPAGQHRFPFQLELPAKIPATSRIPQGLVEYQLQATASSKSIFSPDVHAVKEMVVLPPPTVPHTLCGKTVAGVLYSASAFCDAHRRIRLLFHLSARSTIRSFRCGLRQSVQWRSSVEHECINYENYPLGWMSPPELDSQSIADTILFVLPSNLPQDSEGHLLDIKYHVVIRMTVDDDTSIITLELPVVIPFHDYPGSPPPEYTPIEPPPTYLQAIHFLPIVPAYAPSCN
ncbi:hypothetical protein BX666DRAFT_1949036 [Dichotomocladium elegans]|nr:hypothetical protein BX666DRAFT_1949036 [Dichotomocladium elegans]